MTEFKCHLVACLVKAVAGEMWAWPYSSAPLIGLICILAVGMGEPNALEQSSKILEVMCSVDKAFSCHSTLELWNSNFSAQHGLPVISAILSLLRYSSGNRFLLRDFTRLKWGR